MIPIRLLEPLDHIEDNDLAWKLISLDPSIYLPYNTPEDIFCLLISGTLQMWTLGNEGGVLTRTDLHDAPGGELKVLRVMYAMGKTDDLADRVKWFMSQIEEIARSNGTHYIRVECGRGGWVRLLPDYHVEQLVLGKKL